MIEVKGLCRGGRVVARDVADNDPLFDGGTIGTQAILPALKGVVGQVGGEARSFVWIALTDPSLSELTMVGELLDLPGLQVEDAANPRGRPKIEVMNEQSFIVFKILEYVEATSDIETNQMSVFVGHGYVVTVANGWTDRLDWVLPQLESGDELLQFGGAAVLHAVLDKAVDQYLKVVDEISGDIEQIEVDVFSPERADDTEAIYQLKRENLEIRRAVNPLMMVAASAAREQLPNLPDELKPYFRDIADHVLRAGDAVDTNDNLLLTMLMAATARLDLQQNKDMRKIAAWVSMGVVPTLIAGIFGMNFDYMPQLHETWGYPAVLTLMVAVSLFMYTRFKKSGWL